MKKTTLIILSILSFSFGISQTILEKKIEMEFTNTPLKTILKEVSDKHKIDFSYGNVDLSSKKTISFNGSLKKGLNKLFESKNIDYKMINNQIVLKPKVRKTQTIRGRVLDMDTKNPIFGASVILLNSDPFLGASSDLEGYFKIKNVPIGRHNIQISFIGYEKRNLSQVLVSSGKELVLNIEMQEALTSLGEFVVEAKVDKTKAQNDMATLSARTFSVEETQRYAGSLKDPARMAQSFAGVTGGGNDLENEIIIRGNSSRGLQWRLEGVEIISPNHFSIMGSGGGAVSMLSSSTLSNSDFYTGAFPAEFGNSLSGVFDLKLREGNNEKREYSFMVGVLGIEASAEGYFSKKSRASYLVNYRYSTTSLISKVLTLEGLPTYQDLSFKISVPTKKLGDFSIFGLGGQNRYSLALARDTSKIVNGGSETFGINYSTTGVIGITNKKVLNKKSYLSTNIALSGYRYDDEYTKFSRDNNVLSENIVFKTLFENYYLIGSMTYNYKFNSKHKLRTGFIAKQSHFQFNFNSLVDSTLISFIDKDGSAELYRTFAQWKYRMNDSWTLNTGAHFSYLALNNTYAIDPRVSLNYQFKPNQSIAFSAGMHSKPEHISTYFIDRTLPNGTSNYPNKDLEMLKAVHFVVGYDWSISENLKVKVEGYYQHLYDIPVSNYQSSSFSILNVSNVFKLIFDNDKPGEFLVNEGTAKNYGIDITFERYFNKGYYFLFTGSVFDSKFKTLSGVEHQTKYASNYSFNLLGGKEIKVGKTKQNIFGFNGKIKYAGGNRYTPIDLDASILAGKTVEVSNSIYSAQIRDYFRIDLGISFKINRKKSTHTFMLDIQNVMNRKNPHSKYFSSNSNKIKEGKQNGLIPVVNYRVEF